MNPSADHKCAWPGWQILDVGIKWKWGSALRAPATPVHQDRSACVPIFFTASDHFACRGEGRADGRAFWRQCGLDNLLNVRPQNSDTENDLCGHSPHPDVCRDLRQLLFRPAQAAPYDREIYRV